jgi:cell division protein FtsB
MAQGRSVRPKRATAAQVSPRKTFSKPNLATSMAFLAIALYMGVTLSRLGLQEWNLLQKGRILQAEQANVLAEKQRLENDIVQSRTNAGIEKLAREELGLVSAQEIPVKTIPAPVVTALAPQAAHALGWPPAMAAVARMLVPTWH